MQIISSSLVLIIVSALILLPSSKPTSGASLFAEWTTKGDFENNASTTGGATSPNANVNIGGTNPADDTTVTLADPQGPFLTIAAGYAHSLGIQSDTKLFAWGNNVYGQLGDGTTTQRESPVQIGTDNWQMVAGGNYHSLGIREDGKLFAWGRNNVGQLGDGTVTDRWSPVQIGTSNWQMVAGGASHSLGIREDGKLFAWGYNVYGRLGDGTTTNRYSPVQIGTSNWQTIAAGGAHSLGIRDDGKLLAWGYNYYGQLGDGTETDRWSPVQIGTSNWQMIAAGDIHSLGLREDGKLFAWGYNGYGRLGDGTTTNRYSPVQIGTSNWQTIAAGQYHSLGIREDAKLFAWGRNNVGQLGDGTVTDRWSPVQIGTSNWQMVAASGEYHSLGLRDDGKLFAWGANGNGQLGDGTTTQRTTPTQIGTDNWKSPYIYPSPGIISGFKINAGTGIKAKWSTISWTNPALPANTAIKFRTRGADTEAGLSSASWSGYYTTSGSSITTTASQWLEIELTLQSTDGVSTPTLNSFRVNYDVIDPPGAGNLSMQRVTAKSDGSTSIADGGYTNETSVKINGSSLTGLSDSTGLTFEVQKAESPAYTFRSDNLPDASGSVTSGSASATVTGLSVDKSYKFRARLKDTQNRYSAWTHYYSGNVALSVEQTAPDAFTLSSPANAYSTSNTSPSLSWNASADSGSGLARYELVIDGSTSSPGRNNISALAGSTTPATALLLGAHTWQIKAVDNADNATLSETRTIDVLAIAKPQEFSIMNASEGTDYRLLLSWRVPVAESGTTTNNMPSGDSINYRIYRSTTANFFDNKTPTDAGMSSYLIKSTNGTYDALGSTDNTKRFYLDTNVSGSNSGASTFYYAITAIDNSGNESAFVTASATPNGYGIGTQPTVSNVNHNSATISWTPNFASDSTVIYRKQGETTIKKITSNTIVGANNAHMITLNELDKNAVYEFMVRNEDAGGQAKQSTDWLTFRTEDFSISSITRDVTANRATISWTTSILADSKVEYWQPGDEHKVSGRSTMASLVNGLYSHQVVIENLKPSAAYDFKVISETSSGDKTESNGVAFKTDDFNATVIDVKTTASSATISWKTNEAANSFVNYGTRDTSEKIAGDRQMTKNHILPISDLKPGTKYKFKVLSQDAFGNTASSAEDNFEAKPFKITGISSDTSTNTATIIWDTNIEATSSVEYKSSDDQASLVATDDSLTKMHKVVIKGLQSSTTYSYKIKSRDKDDNIAESGGFFSFRTKSANTGFNVRPSSSKVSEKELTSTSAKISWTTANATSSWVEYGFDKDYGKLGGNDTLTIDHIITIEGLIPGKTYHYRVKGTDVDGNEYISGDYTFAALIKPKVVGVPKVSTTDNSATISWVTNTATDSIVEYGSTELYGNSAGSGIATKEHQINIGNLIQDKTYHFRVGGVDQFFNKALSQDFTFKTNKDTHGPVISGVRNEVLRTRGQADREKISVVINFTTDELTTSYIEYAEGITMASYNKRTRSNDIFSLSHSFMMEQLNPATTYHFRIVAKDRYGNVTKSLDRSILTPRESESVLQKIVKVLEDTFGWVNNVRKYFIEKGKENKIIM